MKKVENKKSKLSTSPIVGKMCIVRTYSAGVFAGRVTHHDLKNPDVVIIGNPQSAGQPFKDEDAAWRLWSFGSGGKGRGIDGIASNPMNSDSRQTKVGKQVCAVLTNVIEITFFNRADAVVLKELQTFQG